MAKHKDVVLTDVATGEERRLTTREGKHIENGVAEFVAQEEMSRSDGYWWSPERTMLQAAIDDSQQQVNGSVRLKLYKGNVTVVGRKSPHTLYDAELVTFEEDEVYDQSDATGFIRLNALRLRVRATRDARRAAEAGDAEE